MVDRTGSITVGWNATRWRVSRTTSRRGSLRRLPEYAPVQTPDVASLMSRARSIDLGVILHSKGSGLLLKEKTVRQGKLPTLPGKATAPHR